MTGSRQKLAQYITDQLATGDPDLAKKVAAYLVQTNRTNEVNSLARDILQARTDKTGTVEVTAVAAHELTKQQVGLIKEMVKKTHPNAQAVIVNQRLDSDVIGGIRLEFANELFDNTVDSRLKHLREITRNHTERN